MSAALKGSAEMATISVITPVYQPKSDYLQAAGDSVAAQHLPAGWELEWLVQEDGRTDDARQILESTPWIKHGRNRHSGQAITRNLALARARGGLVRNLDQDDILTSGALIRDIGALEANPDVGWATSRVLDLLPDGSTEGFEHDPPSGRIERGKRCGTGVRMITDFQCTQQPCVFDAHLLWPLVDGWPYRGRRTPDS